MSRRSTDERRLPNEVKAIEGDPPPTPRERERGRKITELVIEHRRKVLEELAKH